MLHCRVSLLCIPYTVQNAEKSIVTWKFILNEVSSIHMPVNIAHFLTSPDLPVNVRQYEQTIKQKNSTIFDSKCQQ